MHSNGNGVLESQVTMRLKSSLHTAADEDGLLVTNHNINARFGEKTQDFADIGRDNLNPDEVTRLRQDQWPLPERRVKPIPELNANMNGLKYTPQKAPSPEDGGDHNISSPKDERADDRDECEDSGSDFSETSPLLRDFDELNSADEEDDEVPCSPIGRRIEDCNNNMQSVSEDGECSVFSDLLEMSDSKEESYFVLENNYNNNFQRDTFLVTNFPSHICIDDEEKGVNFSSNSASPLPDDDDILSASDLITSSASSDAFIPPSDNGFEYLTEMLYDKVNQTNMAQDLSAVSSDSESEMIPVSSSSTDKIDVNLVTSNFNNFALSASKHNDILSLVETKQKSREANIQEIEHKILNTGQENLPRNMTEEYQCSLRHKDHPRNSDINCKELVDCSHTGAIENNGLTLGHRTIDTGSNKSIQPFDRESTDSDDEISRGLPEETTEFSEAINVENGQHLNCSPFERDELKRSDVKVSESVQERVCNISQLTLVSDNSNVKQNSDWCGTEHTENPSKCLDIESPIDNLIPAESVSVDGPIANHSHSEYNQNSDVNKSVIDTLAKEMLSESSTNRRNTSVHANCKTISPAREVFGDFDVYNIETTMPTIDWVAMEAHLTRAAKEDDWLIRRRNDREEIRKKLAMDSDSEEYYCGERVTRKPSLSRRLQSGMNLQICFMNEAASDQESQGSDHDSESGPLQENIELDRTPVVSENTSTFLHLQKPTSINFMEHSTYSNAHGTPTAISNGKSQMSDTIINKVSVNKRHRPTFFFARQRSRHLQFSKTDQQEQNVGDQKDPSEPNEDFYTCHARLQAEARMALAQAKEMARMQMEVERQRSKKSPIADIVGLPFSDNHHHISRQMLTDMNVAQLQVIVNDLHTQIENLNEELVQLLLNRDDLHMEQDSMLVDIEDLTRYLGAKDEALQNPQTSEENQSLPQLTQFLKNTFDK